MKPDGEQGTPSLALLVLMARLQRSSRFSSYTSRTAVRLALRCVCYGRKQQMIEQGDSSTLPLYYCLQRVLAAVLALLLLSSLVVGKETHMELKREHVEWLSLVRYQSDLAENQAKEPEPLNAVSISTIHDAVESMLSLIAEAHQVATSSKDFAKLFDTVSARI